MDISKTLFKRYCKCKKYYNLDLIYTQKYQNNYQEDVVSEMLECMFSEIGDDLINVPDEQIEVMLPYYQKVEEIALKEASLLFNKPFEYHINTLDQKCFSFKDEENNSLYTYLDGYYEDEKEIIVIEVKAITDNAFMELGPKEKGVFNCLFEKNGQIIKLKDNLNKNQLKHYPKLYDKNNKAGKYLYDLGITSYIIKQKNINKKIRYYLAILNSKFVFDGSYIDGEPSYYKGDKKIMSFVDCSNLVQDYHDIISKEYQVLKEVINSNQINNEPFSKECKNCSYQKVCFPKLQEKYSINTLMGKAKINGQTKYELFNQNICFINDLNPNDLENDKHLIQYNTIQSVEYINKDNIINELKKIQYPIYHLDFEGFNGPLPRFVNEHPYIQSIFQYSIHVERENGKCDRIKDNYHFVPTDFLDHREELIKEMIKVIDLSSGGTVLVYNKSYEHCRIQEFIKMFPKYQKPLQEIDNAIYDLLDLIKGVKIDGFNYYHRDFNGSLSIKKVLPVFSNLSYKDLMIHNGVEAIVNYAKFKNMALEDILDTRNKLIEYCGLDTYSMFVVLQGIKEKVGYKD